MNNFKAYEKFQSVPCLRLFFYWTVHQAVVIKCCNQKSLERLEKTYYHLFTYVMYVQEHLYT